MKTLTTIFLILALTAPGTVFAGPTAGVVDSLWQSVVEWVTDAMGGNVDPVGLTVTEPESPATLAAPDEREPETPQQSENSEVAPPPLPNAGGFVDPVG